MLLLYDHPTAGKIEAADHLISPAAFASQCGIRDLSKSEATLLVRSGNAWEPQTGALAYSNTKESVSVWHERVWVIQWETPYKRRSEPVFLCFGDDKKLLRREDHESPGAFRTVPNYKTLAQLPFLRFLKD
jgi:hypothetical protein